MAIEIWASVENCPVCGKELAIVELVRTCGHVRADEDGQVRRVLFSACREHYDQAVVQLRRDESHAASGYLGEWEPRFGILGPVAVTGQGEE